MLEGMAVSVVVLKFDNYNDCCNASNLMNSQGIHWEYVGQNRLEVLIQYVPGDLLRFLRMGQRELRWKKAEDLKGGGDDNATTYHHG